MRLSKIKLAGFKSFVDPTTIPLPSNLMGVVGPNGCGKSNIIDAVRWVMGESSAKHLRGDSMTDVIFNGSSARKPVGQASIELIFDNSDGTLGGQYAQYNEISIKRTVTRDAQSFYQLNGTRCRRRDITDIFLGTGLGPRSYAIIEQGTISRLIEAKPDELRVFLEEAAGISKYKERRRETENRIRHTRENLDRLGDLREELDKQLAHLQRQARTAEKFKELKAEERLVKAQLTALRWRGLDQQFRQRELLIGEQATVLEARIARQRAIEAEMEKQREGHVEATEAFNEVQARFYATGSDIARLEQSIQHARERRQQQQQDLEQAERAWHEVQQHLESDRAKVLELEAALAEAEPAQREAEAAERLTSEAQSEAEQAMHELQGQWDEFNQRASEPTQTAQVERARMQHLEQHLGQLRQRSQRLEEEQQALGPGDLEQEVALLQEQRGQLELQIADLQLALQSHLDRIGEQRDQNEQLAGELDGLRGRLQSLRGRQASLEALQQAALGTRDGAVTAWLERHGLSDARRLAQGLEVDTSWEGAVEAALGLHLEAVCVDGLDAVGAALAHLEEGALALFDTGGRASTDHNGGVPLLSKVRAPWALDGLLAGVYAADSLPEALAMQPRLAAHESVITREGVWLGAGWARLSREQDEKAGVLQREQELKLLAEEAGQLAAAVEELEQRLEEGRSQLRFFEEEREAQQQRLNEANRRHAELRAQESGKQARMEQIVARRERLRHDREELAAQIERDEGELGEARARLHQALELMEEFAVQREELTGRREATRDALESARGRAREARDSAHRIALQVQSTNTALVSTRESLERMGRQLEQLGLRRETLRAALAENDAPVQALQQELETLLARRLEVEGQLAEARRRVSEIDEAMRALEAERAGLERDVQEIRAGLEQARLGSQELKVRRATLQEQLQEAGFSPEAMFEAMPEGATEQAWQEQVAELERRIQRLGAINLAAIDEYGQQSERKNYLDAQHADLMEALETLENAIRKIDRETRTRFKETFDKVNSGLQAMFPRLFGGGHAYLELTGDDLLDTGVTVMARPPGKRNSTIHLLSGGEKALTAVALVFAIFELNPSPFCMLDEVDAPLDEANVGRFCNLVKEMSARIQFIFITHNKTTMALAEHLAGVTMSEPGVSRLVAVDVDEAAEMAAVGA